MAISLFKPVGIISLAFAIMTGGAAAADDVKKGKRYINPNVGFATV